MRAVCFLALLVSGAADSSAANRRFRMETDGTEPFFPAVAEGGSYSFSLSDLKTYFSRPISPLVKFVRVCILLRLIQAIHAGDFSTAGRMATSAAILVYGEIVVATLQSGGGIDPLPLDAQLADMAERLLKVVRQWSHATWQNVTESAD